MNDALLNHIRSENLTIYRTSAQRLREDVGQEDEIARDYRGRLLYELIQNADDAIDPDHSAKLRIELHDGGLWFANSGRALSEGDVRGICGVSASTKRAEGLKRRASIGNKGMGFKSVLEISRAPEVYSTSHCFCFDESRSLAFLHDAHFHARHAPLMRLPWPISTKNVTWERLISEGFVTAFYLPFTTASASETHAALAAALQTLPETTFLFLKQLEVVEVAIGDDVRAWRICRERAICDTWTPARVMDTSDLYRVRLEANHEKLNNVEFLVAYDGHIEIGAHRGGLAGVAWEDIDITEVSVAVQLADGIPAPTVNPLVHVFLPTQEQMPYPFLINGAFASGLSRQSIRVENDPFNYNSFLLHQAARLMTDALIPALAKKDRRATLALLSRNRNVQTPLAAMIYQAMRARVSALPLVPAESGDLLAPCHVLLPPLLPGVGTRFRSVLSPSAGHGEARFPQAQWCDAETAHVLADHGAAVLTPTASAAALAHADPHRSLAHKDSDLAVHVDPVLRILEQLWEGYGEGDRAALVQAVRALPLLPVDINPDQTWRREAVAQRAAFFPPKLLHGDVPLPGLCFLSQAICWGELNSQARLEALKDKMVAWQGLFGLQEFTFLEVMRASVLPYLALERVQKRDKFHDIAKLAAICQLSGKTSQQSRLPTERLGSQRALFNLARLEVPCRGPNGTTRWVAAYQAYFGADWIGDRSVERLLDACQSVGVTTSPDVPFVLGPERFAGYLAKYAVLTHPSEPEDAAVGDEVGLDEDEDASLPTAELDRWREFFSWLGVNDHLRAVHFHDVEERDAGWLTTDRLCKPRGWIFTAIPDDTWTPWQAQLVETLRANEPKRFDGCRRWFYDVHHLEHLDALLSAATADVSCVIGSALYEHIKAHWSALRHVEFAVVALTEGHPTRRKPKIAYNAEKVRCGDNFWLWQLKRAAFCPTEHGPRLPSQVWRPSREMERRFRQTGSLLPLLTVPEPGTLAGVLGIRGELTPSAFKLDDAAVWLERLEAISSQVDDISARIASLSVACRHLMELLVGHQPEEARADVRLPALYNSEIVWLPAERVFFAERRLSDKLTALPIFVLEADQRAKGPLQACFGVRLLERALIKTPSPGDPALDGAELDLFRKAITALGPALLARLGADRQEDRQAADDARTLQALLQGLMPVTSLTITMTLDGQPVATQANTDAAVYVDRANPSCAFSQWSSQAWPPHDDDAERLAEALGEVFGQSWYEPFLAMIKASDDAARLRTLRRAGAPTDLAAYQRRLDGDSDLINLPTRPPLMPARSLSTASTALQISTAGMDKNREKLTHPLWSVASLVVLGEPVQIAASYGSVRSVTDGLTGVHEGGQGAGSRSQSSTYTDLRALDQLGMHVALSFERARLARQGGGLVFDVSHPNRIQAEWAALRQIFEQQLMPNGIASDWPGFDILSLNAQGQLSRMIELKSSGVSARMQEFSWNEWKSAGQARLREHYYLYLVGNLRSDLCGNRPFIRTVQDPFGQLQAEMRLQTKTERKIQLAVSKFREAEEEILEVVQDES